MGRILGQQENEQVLFLPLREWLLEQFAAMGRGIIEHDQGGLSQELAEAVECLDEKGGIDGVLSGITDRVIIRSEQAEDIDFLACSGKDGHLFAFSLPAVGNTGIHRKARLVPKVKINLLGPIQAPKSF